MREALFKETFQAERYQEIGIILPFVQDNSVPKVCSAGSISKKRGHRESSLVVHEEQCGTSWPTLTRGHRPMLRM